MLSQGFQARQNYTRRKYADPDCENLENKRYDQVKYRTTDIIQESKLLLRLQHSISLYLGYRAVTAFVRIN